MQNLRLLIILLLFYGCRAERYYYQKSFEKFSPELVKGDTLIFPFKGKSNPHQYWEGSLIAYSNQNDLIINEYGQWEQYFPEDTTEILTITKYDTLGQGLILSSKVHNNSNNKLFNQVTCKDTLINNIKIRKCDFRWYFNDGKLSQKYSLITFGNPGDFSKKYGEEIHYFSDGDIKSYKLHQPKVLEGKIK